MHHIYHTKAFVLGSRPAREDSKVLILFTEELGLVYAYTQGVRKLSSKLRFTLQDFSEAQVDLVRGKDMWRVTTATPLRSFASVHGNPKSEQIVARVAALLVRLVAGEEPNKSLFVVVTRLYDLLEAGIRSSEEYRALELLFVSRILTELGYLSATGMHMTTPDIPADLPEIFTDIAFQHRLIRDINQALAATQL